MTFTPTMWTVLETAREKPYILLRPDQIGPARLLERGGISQAAPIRRLVDDGDVDGCRSRGINHT
jgi:hypothetical protein